MGHVRGSVAFISLGGTTWALAGGRLAFVANIGAGAVGDGSGVDLAPRICSVAGLSDVSTASADVRDNDDAAEKALPRGYTPAS